MAGAGAGLGALGGLVGSIVGEVDANTDMDQARHLAWTISRKYGNLPLPTILKLHPELMGDTAFAQAYADPKYTSIEDDALDQMMQRANGGMGPEDEANLLRARTAAQNESTATMGALDRQAQRRGMAGGTTSVNKAVAAQQGVNRLHSAGVEAAGDASQRALQALSMGSRYASSLAGRDLDQKNTVAGARDRISEFNYGRKDRADAYNNEIGQRQFGNQLDKLGGETAGLKLMIDQYGEKANSKRRMGRGVGEAAGTFAGFLGG